jgi:hypothetical protein
MVWSAPSPNAIFPVVWRLHSRAFSQSSRHLVSQSRHVSCQINATQFSPETVDRPTINTLVDWKFMSTVLISNFGNKTDEA